MYIKNKIYIFNKKLPETALSYRQWGGVGGVWLSRRSASPAALRSLTTSVLFQPLLPAHSPGTWLLEALSGKRFANAPLRLRRPQVQGASEDQVKGQSAPGPGQAVCWSGPEAGWRSGNLSWRRTEGNQVWIEQRLWETCAETASWVNSWPSRACPRGSPGRWALVGGRHPASQLLEGLGARLVEPEEVESYLRSSGLEVKWLQHSRGLGPEPGRTDTSVNT